MAYLLKLKNFPTGNSELPVGKEALSAIRMERPWEEAKLVKTR